MLLTDLVAPNAIIPALKVNSKKQVLQELAAKAAELCGQSERTILEILQQREKLGSTGVGNGIAIPHGKLPKLNRSISCFCCSRRKPPAPTISRRWRASRASCAMPMSPASCVIHATPKRSMPCLRCPRPRLLDGASAMKV